jgi:hypothetical protein
MPKPCSNSSPAKAGVQSGQKTLFPCEGRGPARQRLCSPAQCPNGTVPQTVPHADMGPSPIEDSSSRALSRDPLPSSLVASLAPR